MKIQNILIGFFIISAFVPAQAMVKKSQPKLPEIKFSKDFSGLIPFVQVGGYVTFFKHAKETSRVYVSSVYLRKKDLSKAKSGWDNLSTGLKIFYSKCEPNKSLLLECKSISKEENKYVVRILAITKTGGQSFIRTDPMLTLESAQSFISKVGTRG